MLVNHVKRIFVKPDYNRRVRNVEAVGSNSTKFLAPQKLS